MFRKATYLLFKPDHAQGSNLNSADINNDYFNLDGRDDAAPMSLVERVSCPYVDRLSLTGSRRLNAHIWRLAN